MSTPRPLGALVTDRFRAVEIAMLSRVLCETLAAALPSSAVSVRRRRSVTDRLRGRDGVALGIRVVDGNRVLQLDNDDDGRPEASIGHRVRGVTLSTTAVPIDRWLDELARALDDMAATDEAARVALERAVLA